LGADVREVFDFARSVRSREIVGGTGPNAVREQIERAKKTLAEYPFEGAGIARA
jgi:argininosuccinate lyase